MLQLIRDQFNERDFRCLRGFLSQSPGHLLGGARPAPAGGCAEAETSTTDTESPRSALWDRPAECVAAMVGCSRHRETNDRNRVASKRLPTLLALAIQAAGWSAYDY